jgi:hypothetical protein
MKSQQQHTSTPMIPNIVYPVATLLPRLRVSLESGLPDSCIALQSYNRAFLPCT